MKRRVFAFLNLADFHFGRGYTVNMSFRKIPTHPLASLRLKEWGSTCIALSFLFLLNGCENQDAEVSALNEKISQLENKVNEMGIVNQNLRGKNLEAQMKRLEKHHKLGQSRKVIEIGNELIQIHESFELKKAEELILAAHTKLEKEQKEEQEAFDKSLESMRKFEAQDEKVTWYASKKSPAPGERTAVIFLAGVDNEDGSLRMKVRVQYSGEKILDIQKSLISADSETLGLSSRKKIEIEGGDLSQAWEWVEGDLKSEAFIKKLVSARICSLEMIGQNRTERQLVPFDDKTAMKDVLGVLKILRTPRLKFPDFPEHLKPSPPVEKKPKKRKRRKKRVPKPQIENISVNQLPP